MGMATITLYKVFGPDSNEINEFEENDYYRALECLDKAGPGSVLEKWEAECKTTKGHWDEYHGGCPPETTITGKYFVGELATWEDRHGKES